MSNLIDEARRMPNAAIGFARHVSEVRVPEHLVPLRKLVLARHASTLGAVHATLVERFDRTTQDYLNVFKAAAEQAVMAEIGQRTLPAGDYQLLRSLWVALLRAR